MKCQKNSVLGPFWALLPILGQTITFLENPRMLLFPVFRFLLLHRFSEKPKEQIPRKAGYRRAEG